MLLDDRWVVLKVSRSFETTDTLALTAVSLWLFDYKVTLLARIPKSAELRSWWYRRLWMIRDTYRCEDRLLYSTVAWSRKSLRPLIWWQKWIFNFCKLSNLDLFASHHAYFSRVHGPGFTNVTLEWTTLLLSKWNVPFLSPTIRSFLSNFMIKIGPRHVTRHLVTDMRSGVV